MAILREIALTSGGDLEITNGELVIVDGTTSVAQRIQTRLRTLLGEWVFDTQIGTPWLQSILGRAPRLDLIRTLIRDRIALTQGVDRVTRLDLSFAPGTRVLTVTGSAVADNDAVIDISTGVGV